jgi:transcriptional regulator with XRE-family HTH domain
LSSSLTYLIASAKHDLMKRSHAERIAEAVREGAARSGMSIRELARVSRVSPAQINRLRAAQANATLDTLVAIARALGRNPNLLFVASGHLSGDEARDILRRVFRDGSEHVEVWKSQGRDVGHARQTVEDAATREDELAELALEVFLGQESEENLWHDPFLGSVVVGEDAPQIRVLLRDWAYLTDARKEKVVDFVRDQAELARRESTDEMREEAPDYGKP